MITVYIEEQTGRNPIRTIPVTKKMFINMCLLLFFMPIQKIRSIEESTPQRESYTLYVYNDMTNNRASRNHSNSHSHNLLYYERPGTNDYVITSLDHAPTMQFYEISLFGERYQKLRLNNNIHRMRAVCRSIHKTAPSHIGKMFFQSGSTQMLYGLRYNRDYDIFADIPATAKEKIMAATERLATVEVHLIDMSVDPLKTILEKGMFYFMGLKVMDIIPNLYLHYLHPGRDFLINSKLDLIMTKKLLGDKIHLYIPIPFREIHPVDIKKMMNQAVNKYKTYLSKEEIRRLLEEDNTRETRPTDTRIQPDFKYPYYKYNINRPFVSPVYFLSDPDYFKRVKEARFDFHVLEREHKILYNKVQSGKAPKVVNNVVNISRNFLEKETKRSTSRFASQARSRSKQSSKPNADK
jgi:hypothetical protein